MKSLPRSGLSFARLAALAAAAATLSSIGCVGSTYGGLPRAPELVARPGCSLWTGTIHGNDPEARMDLELCRVAPGSPEVMGRVQLSSPRSGWSVREVEGAVEDDGTLALHDFQFDVYQPELGWMFCLIDEYELRRTGPRGATGTYESKECSDRAKIKLRRVR